MDSDQRSAIANSTQKAGFDVPKARGGDSKVQTSQRCIVLNNYSLLSPTLFRKDSYDTIAFHY